MNTDPMSMAERMERLERVNASLRTRMDEMEARHGRAIRRFRAQAFLAFCVTAALLMLPGSRKALAQQTGGVPSLNDRVTALEQTIATLVADITDLQTRAAALEQKTQYLSVSGKEMYITGANLHILNGMGSTDTINGLGNLIIGYDAGEGSYKRTGSHNIVNGDNNSYTSYGGVILGKVNAIGGPYACVLGGQFNSADGDSATVLGGWGNLSHGAYTSISGGQENFTLGTSASVSGGERNQANGFGTSISGGFANIATGIDASISGGLGGQAQGDTSAISGGNGNTTVGEYSVVSGGQDNTTYARYSAISGGLQRYQIIDNGWSGGSQGTQAFHGLFESP